MKYSIITINFNNADGLCRTIESILNQTFRDFEYLIIDGGSADGSYAIIENYSEHISYWISESDNGIYNAMNKGILQAKGDYLLFINSGDELANEQVLKNIDNCLDVTTELASGRLIYIDQQTNHTLEAPEELTLSYSINVGLTHPNTLIRKSLFDKYGLYNENNKIVSDWEFFLIAGGLNNCRYQKMDVAVARFYAGGISSSQPELMQTEMEAAIKRLVSEPIRKDLEKSKKMEQKLSNPAYGLIANSATLRYFLKLLYKVVRKLKGYK